MTQKMPFRNLKLAISLQKVAQISLNLYYLQTLIYCCWECFMNMHICMSSQAASSEDFV